MSGEIEVSETPNWLQELEAKRERRLKARLGHETGAGAPCLKCGDKCPGLDLHFWRKCCKICKCSKEEHEVQDDDIYGWAQFQLLGSKPNKIKRKIILPGKKDEVELDWAPKGHKETVDKYLKTLPPEQLPVKGSQAAQDRKQLLQKQIPIHDIDPTLCHELTEEEFNQMNDYIAHVKQTSVGVGQIVSLSSLIKANLHNLNPSEAAIIASRYAKGIPLSEIVKLQSQSRAGLLKSQGLSQNLEKLNLNDPHARSLPTYAASSLHPTEQNLNPLVANKVHDINYPGYTRDINQTLPNAQFSSGLRPESHKGFIPGSQSGQNQSAFDPTINDKYLQNPNFDPKSIPSHFISQNTPYGQAYSGKGDQPNVLYDDSSLGYKSGDGANQVNSAFVPYNKVYSGFRPGENYVEENPPSGVNYSSSLHGHGKNVSSGFKSGGIAGQNISENNSEGTNPQYNYAKNLTEETGGRNINRITFGDQFPSKSIPTGGSPHHKPGHVTERSFSPQIPKISSGSDAGLYENAEELRNRNIENLPNYAPGKFTVQSEIQSPAKVPRNVRDLAFSTYDQSSVNPNELEYNVSDPKHLQNLSGMVPGQAGVPFENYPSGFRPENVSAVGKTDQTGKAIDSNIPSGGSGNNNDYFPSGFRPINAGAANDKYPYGHKAPYDQFLNKSAAGEQGVSSTNYPPGISDGDIRGLTSANAFNRISPSGNLHDLKALGGQPSTPHDNFPSGFGPGSNSAIVGNSYPGRNVPGQQPHEKVFGNVPEVPGNVPGVPGNVLGVPGNVPGVPGNVPGAPGNIPRLPTDVPGNKPGKKLSELQPGKININEDFLQPSQVTIGAIQDINYPEIKAAIQGTNDFYEDYSPDSLREILNNVILPDCHYCKKPFEENEFAITIDRANVLFHADCFKCAGCNQILADNVYFYNKETDNIYCGRDYAKIRGFPRCKACDELIFTKEYCLAENSTFHLKHFCCRECDIPLAGQDYILEEEMPFCIPCFEQNKASKCSSCCRVIKPDEMGCNLNGVHFHASDDCFACKMCKKPLMGKKLLLRNEKLYCSHDCFGADK